MDVPHTVPATHSKLTLYYFPLRGLGEEIRIVLEEIGVEYDDIRAPIGSELHLDLKAKLLPFGQVPLLIDGTHHLVQSKAILRYLGRKHNLYGDTEDQKIVADTLTEATVDFRSSWRKITYSTNFEHEKDDYINKELPPQLAKFENYLKKGGHTYFASNNVTFADLVFYELLDLHTILAPHCLDAFPQLKAFKTHIEERPKIKAYLASGRRPKFLNGPNAPFR